MAKVYVSSAYLGLEDERRAVIDWLVAAGHQRVHSYRPDSETVRESCLADVDTCDLYVLIFGHRYVVAAGGGQPGATLDHATGVPARGLEADSANCADTDECSGQVAVRYAGCGAVGARAGV